MTSDKIMQYISKNGNCENHCMNKTSACYSCELNSDCDCELVDNQPEINRREDFDCCKHLKDLQDIQQHYEVLCQEYFIERGYEPEHSNTCESIEKIVYKAKMRCSEHCENTVTHE